MAREPFPRVDVSEAAVASGPDPFVRRGGLRSGFWSRPGRDHRTPETGGKPDRDAKTAL